MGEYDPALLCFAAANILMHLSPGTQTNKAIKCAGFKQVDIEYEKNGELNILKTNK